MVLNTMKFVHAEKLKAHSLGKRIPSGVADSVSTNLDQPLSIVDFVKIGFELGRDCGPEDSVFWFVQNAEVHFFIARSEEELVARSLKWA